MPHRRSQRDTAQRRLILEELRSVSSHPTAVELYEMVRRRMPKISLGTVYRNLDLLSARGMIQKLALGGKETRFDGRVDSHCHARCVRCGRVDDLPEVPGDLVADRPKGAGGYEILGYHLEFVGICPACRANRAGDDCDETENTAG
jgi:Fur family ferric uptake transcriptional regulator